MRYLLIFLMCLVSGLVRSAPFTCDDTLYIALNEPGKTGSVLNVVNDTVYPFTYDPIGSAQTLHNGMGFNPSDGLIYGMLRSTQVTQATIFSADDTGLITTVGTVPGLPNFDFFSGDIGPAPDYNLFLHYIGVVYEVDTDTQTLVNTHALNNNLISFDIAYDQTTNRFYGVERQGNGRFFEINIGAGTLTEIGATGTETFGSMMADSTGRIFGNSNGTNGFFEFDKTTGERRLISETVGGAGDGAYCQDAVVQFRDYGDAPDSYGTLQASNGASHEISLQLYMGNQFDNDIDGFVNGVDNSGIAADDDLTGADDDDGVTTFPPLSATDTNYSIDVNVTNTLANINDQESTLQGWIDFDGNGTFDSDEGSFQEIVPVGTTTQQLAWTVPADTVPGATFVRIRVGRLDLSTRGSFSELNATGAGGLGEVEDYQISIGESPDINITKSLAGAVVNNNDGTYGFSFSIEVENTGNVALTSININDDLASAFSNAVSWSVSNVQSTDFTENGSFDGDNDINLVTGVDGLAVSASGTITFDMVVTPGINLSYTNTANTDGRSPLNTQVFDTDNAIVSMSESPAILLTKVVDQVTNNNDGSFDVDFTITAQNTGDVPLLNVQINDDLATTFQNAVSFNVQSVSSSVWTVNGGYDGSNNIALLQGSTNSLAFGSSASVSISVTVVPGTTLSYTNDAQVLAVSPASNRLSDNASVPFGIVQSPGISVTKSVNGQVVNNNDGTYDFQYEIVVTNTGDVPLNSVQVTDDLATVFAQATSFSIQNIQTTGLTINGSFDGSGDTNLLTGSDTLAFGSSASIFIDLRVEPGSTTVYTNRADAEGTSPADIQVTAFDTEDVSFGENPSITVTKQVSGTPVNNRDGTYSVVFNITGLNNGDVPLSNFQLTDDLNAVFSAATGFTIESVTSSNLNLNPGFNGTTDINLLASQNSLASGAAYDVELSLRIDAGSTFSYTNVVVANGQSPAGANTSDQATANLLLGESPSISVTKSISSITNNNDGTHEVVFQFEITNTGDVNLSDVSLSDDLAQALNLAEAWSVVNVESSDFNVNGAFDGNTNNNLLISENINFAQSGSVNMTVVIQPGNQLDYVNETTVIGLSPALSDVNDTDQVSFSLEPAAPAPPPAMVPTLSEWGIIFMILMFFLIFYFNREKFSV
ncbi:beta strand repeat-containing protein [Marinicella sp. W31]|uniref:beta strand repeat-containing protein n=1 Tax=Marinicella sp. W31 TaxID=3023713 RepID=UPI003757148F